YGRLYESGRRCRRSDLYVPRDGDDAHNAFLNDPSAGVGTAPPDEGHLTVRMVPGGAGPNEVILAIRNLRDPAHRRRSQGHPADGASARESELSMHARNPPAPPRRGGLSC